MTSEYSRAWTDLSWRRWIVAAIVAPLPTLYIGFAGFVLAYSDRSLPRVFDVLFPEPQLYAWGFGIIFAVLYLNLVARFRGRISLIECITAGSAVAVLLAASYFLAIEFDIIGPLPYMTFFPGIVLAVRDNWVEGTLYLGFILAPAGALSGWIFWRLGVAPAVPRVNAEVF